MGVECDASLGAPARVAAAVKWWFFFMTYVLDLTRLEGLARPARSSPARSPLAGSSPARSSCIHLPCFIQQQLQGPYLSSTAPVGM